MLMDVSKFLPRKVIPTSVTTRRVWEGLFLLHSISKHCFSLEPILRAIGCSETSCIAMDVTNVVFEAY